MAEQNLKVDKGFSVGGYQVTKNLSFLRMHKFLKDRGIKNNKFFLKLYDSDLATVDPYAATDPMLRGKIIKEIKINPWYFFREVARIKVPGGVKRYELHRGNLAQTFCLLHNFDIIELLPRQNGKTVGVNFVMLWVFFFGTINTQIIYGNKKLTDSQLNLRRFEEMALILPQWMLPPKDPLKDHESFQTYTRKALGNSITVMPAANSEEDADRLGRGLTTPIVFFDEWAFTYYNSIIYAAAAPALSQASEEASVFGTPHFKVITTTPNSIDTDEGQFCKRMINMACTFDEKIFYDSSLADLKRYVYEHSENNYVHVEFSWMQLGRTKEWYEEQCRNLQYNKQKIKRELDLEWTLSSDKSPFTEDELERVAQFIVPASQEHLLPIRDPGNHKLTLLETVDFYSPVIISADVGAGNRGDYSAISVLDAFDGRTIAYFNTNTLVPLAFARLIIHIAKSVFINSTIVVERNSYGLDVITLILESDVRSKMFYHKTADHKRSESKRTTHTAKQVYGIDTTVSSRDIMISNLSYYVNEEPQTIRNRCILKELKTLERKNTGKIEHSQGEHDDNLFSFLLGRYAMTFESINSLRNRRYTHQEYLGKSEIESRETFTIESAKSSTDLLSKSENRTLKILSYNR